MTEATTSKGGPWWAVMIAMLAGCILCVWAHKEGVKHGYDQRSEAQARYDESDKKVKQEIAVEAIRADVREINAWVESIKERNGGSLAGVCWMGGSWCAKCHDAKPDCCQILRDGNCRDVCKCKPGTCTCCQRCGGSGLPHKPCGCDGCKCCKGCDGDKKGCGCGCSAKCCKEAGCRCDGEHKDHSGCKCGTCRSKGGK